MQHVIEYLIKEIISLMHSNIELSLENTLLRDLLDNYENELYPNSEPVHIDEPADYIPWDTIIIVEEEDIEEKGE